MKLAKVDVDTGGLVYPKAINQLFVGLYVMECYLIGLFFLVRNEHNQVAYIGQGCLDGERLTHGCVFCVCGLSYTALVLSYNQDSLRIATLSSLR